MEVTKDAQIAGVALIGRGYRMGTVVDLLVKRSTMRFRTKYGASGTDPDIVTKVRGKEFLVDGRDVA